MKLDEVIKWFEENYIELDPEKIIEEAAIKHPVSVKSIFESCQAIKLMFPEKTSLKFHLKYLVMMARSGITHYTAGEQLAVYFNLRKIFNEANKPKTDETSL